MSSRMGRGAYLLADAGIVFSDSKKGCSIHARSMIRAFEQEGCQLRTFVMRQGRKVPGFSVREVSASGPQRFWRKRVTEGIFKKNPPNWAVAIHWLLWHRDFYRETLKKLRREDPEFFYVRHAWFSWPYAKLKAKLGLPLVLEVNAVMSVEKASRGEAAFAALTRRIELRGFEAADLILPVSSEIRDQIIAMGIPGDKIVVTPNAVDLELFSPRGPLQNDRVFSIGCVSSFRTYHGLSTLMAAAAILKKRGINVRLVLIGNGPEMGTIRALAGELDLVHETELPGVVDHAKVPELLRSCDVCVCPNEGELNQYNCPMKLYEYMALKVPVVASRWGDIPNIVQDGITGLLHEPANAEDLAQALARIHDDPDAAQQLTQRAYGVAQLRSWRGNARQVLKWLNATPLERLAALKREKTNTVVESCDPQSSSLAKRLWQEADGLPILARAAFVDEAENGIATHAAACRILLDEGFSFLPLVICEGEAGLAADAADLFKRQLGPHRGLFFHAPSTPATLVKRAALWQAQPEEVEQLAQAYVDENELPDLALQLRTFLCDHLPGSFSTSDLIQGWEGFFSEMVQETSPLAEIPPGESLYRRLRPTRAAHVLDEIANRAAGRAVVALAPNIGRGTPSHVFLHCCRQLLDKGSRFYVLMLGAGDGKEVAALNRAFREHFSAAEGEFIAAEACPRHVLNKVAIGVADPAEKGIRCISLLRVNSLHQAALAWQLGRLLKDIEPSRDAQLSEVS